MTALTLSPPALAAWNTTPFPYPSAAWIVTEDFAGYVVDRIIGGQAEREYAYQSEDDAHCFYDLGARDVLLWLPHDADMDDARAEEARQAWLAADLEGAL